MAALTLVSLLHFISGQDSQVGKSLFWECLTACEFTSFRPKQAHLCFKYFKHITQGDGSRFVH